MNNVIVVDYDPFAMESRAQVIKGDNKEYRVLPSRLYEAAEEIINLTSEYNIYNVKVSAPPTFVNELVGTVKAMESLVEDGYLYSEQSKINIEGI